MMDVRGTGVIWLLHRWHARQRNLTSRVNREDVEESRNERTRARDKARLTNGGLMYVRIKGDTETDLHRFDRSNWVEST